MLGTHWLYGPDAWGGMDTEMLAGEIAAGRLRLVERLACGVLIRSAVC